jgi:transposase
MFFRRNKNRSGSVSIQIVQKIGRRNIVVKTVGYATTQREEELLILIAKHEVEQLQGLQRLFIEEDDLVVDAFVDSIANDDLKIVGPQIILGNLYDKIGYRQIEEKEYFRDLVICRLVYPGSKRKTVRYFKRHLNKVISVYSIYRFMDELQTRLKDQIEDITFQHTRKILKGRVGVVFYDMTTLYFEASEEDDFRVPGFSKDGKHQQPQIMIGLLVGENGYPIGYELFEGNTAETKTLIPVLETFQKKFNLGKPIVIADAALLSNKNIKALKSEGYEFILGGRIKNESEQLKQKILSLQVSENYPKEIKSEHGRLIVSYSEKRQKKDRADRLKGLKRLEKRLKSGKLTKDHINNRGYNKYLNLQGEINISIDYEKFEQDSAWDGLKGYVTNTSLSKKKVINAYHQLYQIEKAFRISKTDLKIRPVYHRLRNRIEAHICICFTAYAIYKELERLLIKNNIAISPETALTEMNDIRQLTYMLPKSKQIKTKLLRINEYHDRLLKMKL